MAAVLAVLTVLAGGCSEGGPFGTVQPGDPVALELVVTGLDEPVYLTAPPGDAGRLFIVEKGGAIQVVRDGRLLPNPFLDLGGEVSEGNEQGLLSMAFHPSYQENGYFYVFFTDSRGDAQVVRYTVSGDPDVADPTSAFPILSVEQPFANHNGGLVAFGPDGMLYVGLGDGGGVGDPDGHGQDLATLLGSILRIDVDAGSPYAIPADNPFVDDPDAAPEIWVYGLRNPWRFSFDGSTGDLYIGDVGESDREEISFQPASSSGGENYGWNVLEGTGCFSLPSGCSDEGLVPPVFEYGHDEGCSITGGIVYRGNAVPSLQGRYFFADYCSTWIRSLVMVNGQATDLRDHAGSLGPISGAVSFGEDANGELYVISIDGGVYRFIEG